MWQEKIKISNEVLYISDILRNILLYTSIWNYSSLKLAIPISDLSLSVL